MEEQLKKNNFILLDCISDLRKLEDDLYAKENVLETKFNQDFIMMRTEVYHRFDEIKETLRKAHQRSVKDDKLTKLIKAFLSSF